MWVSHLCFLPEGRWRCSLTTFLGSSKKWECQTRQGFGFFLWCSPALTHLVLCRSEQGRRLLPGPGWFFCWWTFFSAAVMNMRNFTFITELEKRGYWEAILCPRVTRHCYQSLLVLDLGPGGEVYLYLISSSRILGPNKCWKVGNKKEHRQDIPSPWESYLEGERLGCVVVKLGFVMDGWLRSLWQRLQLFCQELHWMLCDHDAEDIAHSMKETEWGCSTFQTLLLMRIHLQEMLRKCRSASWM